METIHRPEENEIEDNLDIVYNFLIISDDFNMQP